MSGTERDHGLDVVLDLELPPEGFSALTASEPELRSYGLPPRPDPNTHPDLAALWDSFAARPLRFVRPPLVPLADHAPSELRNYQERLELPADLPMKRDIIAGLRQRGIPLCWFLPATSTNWSGAVAYRPSTEPLVTVSGQWIVPSVSPPQSAWNGKAYNDGTYKCAVWVGLDGWNGTKDVLQAGTTSEVDVSGGKVTGTSFFAWVEWFGNLWIPESDFPVNPGDSILCTVCAPTFGNNFGVAIFLNQTTGQTAPYQIYPPPSTTLSGNVAEWIVEDPGDAAGVLYPFPNYGLTTFRNCSAGTKNIGLNLTNACPLNLIDGTGKVISQGTIDSATSLTCNFLS